jgi:hypothetical protein
MMALTLAHDYDMIEPLSGRISADVGSFDDLARLIWDVDAPGLPTRPQAVPDVTGAA